MNTAETITNKQIRALREEALTVPQTPDHAMADICAIALGDVVSDDSCYANVVMTREHARAKCARVINNARAQEKR